MWPWGHAAVGYLALSLYSGRREGSPPGGPATIVVGFATMLPDLVDKPLAWTFGVLTYGRTLAHSALVAVVVTVVVWRLVRTTGYRHLVAPFAIGYWSHLLSDGVGPVMSGKLHDLVYLGWPVLPANEPEIGQSIGAHLLALEVSPFFLLQWVLVGVALVAWHRDGHPGVRTLVRPFAPRRRDSA